MSDDNDRINEQVSMMKILHGTKDSNNSESEDSPATVFVIDDSLDMQLLFQTLLEMDGHKVATAASAGEALAVLKSGLAPSLILLDMNLEDATGAEFLTQLETEMPEIVDTVPVVFITGLDQIPQSRAVGYIRKPVDNKKFKDLVRHYLAAKML